MKKLETLSGKTFYFKSIAKEEFIIYPSDKEGNKQEKFAIAITPYIINLVKAEIKRKRQVHMGASRDNPPENSLGALLKREGQTPQQLSYLIPILIDEGFCFFAKEGKAFMINYIEK